MYSICISKCKKSFFCFFRQPILFSPHFSEQNGVDEENEGERAFALSCRHGDGKLAQTKPAVQENHTWNSSISGHCCRLAVFSLP
jgi:hypothetical protein